MWRGERVLMYRFAEKIMQSTVKQATLHVHVQEPSNQDQNQNQRQWQGLDHDLDTVSEVMVQVTNVWRSPGGGAWRHELVTNVTTDLMSWQRRNGSRIKVDVTATIAAWMRMPRNGLGLVVRAYNKRTRHHSSNVQVSLDSVDNLPYLEIYLEDEHRKRTKRTIGLTCTEDSEETRCCRYPLTVDFEDFGWDWIIAPKKYEANFCMGDCPYAFMQKFPNTHVVHLASPPGYPGPCCTPRKMSAIRLLHFDHELNIIVGDIPGMIVERCGCS